MAKQLFADVFAGFAAGKPDAKAFAAETLSTDFAFIYLPYLGTTGVSSAALAPPLVLPRNTLVKRFDLVVGATRATRTPAQAAGQVRAYDNAGVHTVIIDFGVPRTVASVAASADASLKILKVAAWIGAKFDNPFISPPSPVDAARFPSEVRSERLLVTIDRAADARSIGVDLELELPELPTDLELRINDGAPVWTHAGAAQPDNRTVLGPEAFNKDGQRLVPLADALNALLADPLADDPVTLEITLSAKVPGVLSVAEQARELWRIRRMHFAGDTSTALAFANEGRLPLVLDLPAPPEGFRRQVKAVRFTALATPGVDRVLPPVGPPAALNPEDGGPLAELVLDAGRAAIVRLPPEPRLAELTGLRLPLQAGADGAELRVVLWGNAATGAAANEPGEPLPDGASEPLTLDGGTAADPWRSVAFAKPVAIDPLNPPWAALLVARGTLTWALARRADAAGCDLRRGPPNGPWRPLPAAFTSPTGVIDACGRLRRVGRAPKAQPLPPWQVSLDGDTVRVPVVATPKGAAISVEPLAGAGTALQVLAFGAGSLTLRDIDVIWAEPPAAAPA